MSITLYSENAIGCHEQKKTPDSCRIPPRPEPRQPTTNMPPEKCVTHGGRVVAVAKLPSAAKPLSEQHKQRHRPNSNSS